MTEACTSRSFKYPSVSYYGLVLFIYYPLSAFLSWNKEGKYIQKKLLQMELVSLSRRNNITRSLDESQLECTLCFKAHFLCSVHLKKDHPTCSLSKQKNVQPTWCYQSFLWYGNSILVVFFLWRISNCFQERNDSVGWDFMASTSVEVGSLWRTPRHMTQFSGWGGTKYRNTAIKAISNQGVFKSDS